MNRRGHTWGLILLGISAIGGMALASMLADADTGSPDGLKWIAGFVGGFVALLHIIKEVRLLLGFMPRRRSDENLVRQMSELSAQIGEIKSDYAAIAQILKSNGEEIERLRDINEGLDDRISRAMSKVASQTQTLCTTLQDRMEIFNQRTDARLATLEARRR